MKIKIVRHPYMDYEVGDVVDFGEEKNKSLVEEFQRAVWVEEEPKKKSTKKVTKTTTETEEDGDKDSSPARGPDGKFISKKENK